MELASKLTFLLSQFGFSNIFIYAITKYPGANRQQLLIGDYKVVSGFMTNLWLLSPNRSLFYTNTKLSNKPVLVNGNIGIKAISSNLVWSLPIRSALIKFTANAPTATAGAWTKIRKKWNSISFYTRPLQIKIYPQQQPSHNSTHPSCPSNYLSLHVMLLVAHVATFIAQIKACELPFKAKVIWSPFLSCRCCVRCSWRAI